MTELQKNLGELGLTLRPTLTSGPRSICYEVDGVDEIVIDDEGFPWVGSRPDVRLPKSLTYA